MSLCRCNENSDLYIYKSDNGWEILVSTFSEVDRGQMFTFNTAEEVFDYVHHFQYLEGKIEDHLIDFVKYEMRIEELEKKLLTKDNQSA